MHRSLSKSDRLNALWCSPHATLAITIYTLSYPYGDDWGHLPFETTWVKREILPDSPADLPGIRAAMMLLVSVGLWEYVYTDGRKYYTHIFQFEEFSRESLRHRRRGEYPDESLNTPTRSPSESLEDSLRKAAAVRKAVRPATFTGSSGKSPNVPENLGKSPRVPAPLPIGAN